MSNKYDVAAIIWPSYTGDENRSRIFWPEGYGEWQTVKAMTDKGYEGCRWPRKPLWGYCNEADPYVMEMQINCAVRHNINVFIYDWYWYDNRPFLENCLNDGFLGAANNGEMQFYLMWANHSATHLWDKRNSDNIPDAIWNGFVTPQIYSEICDRTIEKYFSKPNYYKIDGCPVYMIFDIDNLIRTFGSAEKCREGLELFREKTKAAGFSGLHLQINHWNNHNFKFLPEDDPCRDFTAEQMYDFLGFNSATNYNWGGFLKLDGEYNDLTDTYMERLESTYTKMNIPFYPNITIGWDNNLRFKGYIPGVVRGNTPEAFGDACRRIKAFADESLAKGVMKAPLLTVNSWNEWTETSYLEPDDLYGYGYLEQIKEIFG